MPGERSQCWWCPSLLVLVIIMHTVSPYPKYAVSINQATISDCRVPLQDNGNMSDVPSHLQDPQGPCLEWLRNLQILLLKEEAPFLVTTK
ncbi:NADH dehydrogenase [ubiquinone] 1 alpha subcomplex subunit 3 [Lemmus lemmus]